MTVAQTSVPLSVPHPRVPRARATARGSLGFSEHLAAGVLIVAATLILLAPLLGGQTLSATGARMFLQFPWAGTVADGPDVRPASYPQTEQADQLYPLSVFLTDALRHRELPLWLPWALGGVPLTALTPLGILYPGRWALALVLDPGRQHDVLLLIHLLLAGFGMYALLRVWGADFAGALLGSLVWEFGGYNMGWLVLERAAVAAAWLPVALLAATLALRRRSPAWALAAGAALSLGALGGGLDLALLSALVVAGWLAIGVVVGARRQASTTVVTNVALGLLTAAVAAAGAVALWLPLLLTRDELRVAAPDGPLHQALAWGALARGLLVPVTSPPNAGFELASLAFVGCPALLLAGVGLASRAAPAALAAAAGGAAVLAAAGTMVLVPGAARFYRVVPPTAALFVFGFAVAVLAALGLTILARRARRRLERWYRLIAPAAVAITAWQLLTFGMAVNPLQPSDAAWRFPATPLIAAIRSVQEQSRLLSVGPTLLGNVSAALGLRSVLGHLPLIPAPMTELAAALAPDHQESAGAALAAERLPLPLLDALSVGLIATPPGVIPTDAQGKDLAEGALRLVYGGEDGWLYQNTAALPRAYLVSRVRTTSDLPTVLETVKLASFDPTEAALVAGSLPPAQAAVLTRGPADSKLLVTPNPVPAGQEAQLSWNTAGNAPSEISVSMDDGPETLVARGASGALSIPWILPGRSYVFRQYADSEHTILIDAVTVATTSVVISVTPNPVSPGEDATLTWSTADGLDGEVWVVEDDLPEALVARAGKGSQRIPWITPYHAYEFRLYAGEGRTTLLARTTVAAPTSAGADAAPGTAVVAGARVAVAPNPVLADGQGASLAWNTPDGTEGEVWVSQDGGPEALVARGAAGTQNLPWIAKDTVYEFRLYAGQEHRSVLATTTVAPPIATGTGLSINDRVLAGRRTVSLSWRMPGRTVGQVWVTAAGTDMLLAQSPAGSRDLPWISPNVTYQFQLYAGTERSALVDLKTVKLDTVDTRRERAAAGTQPPEPVEPMADWRGSAAGTARVVRDGLREVVLEVDAAQPALLVLNDTWMPGWRGSVDGSDQPALRVNYAARGIAVPAGKHEVVFHYEPWALRFALGLSATTLALVTALLACAVAVHRLRRGPAPAPPRTGAPG